MRAFIAALVLAAAFTGYALVAAQPASAGPSPECLAHLERVGKTEKQDQRYWLERGQLPRKCPLREEASQPSESKSSASRADDRDDDRDKKSRFCRKRWWC